jgi:hypothetical protein
MEMEALLGCVLRTLLGRRRQSHGTSSCMLVAQALVEAAFSPRRRGQSVGMSVCRCDKREKFVVVATGGPSLGRSSFRSQGLAVLRGVSNKRCWEPLPTKYPLQRHVNVYGQDLCNVL